MAGSDHLAPDEAEIRKFFEILHEAAAAAFAGVDDPGRLQLSRLHPAHGGLTVVGRYRIGEADRMARDAAIEAEAGFNVYVEGRTVRSDLTGPKRGDLSDTRGVYALVIDDDPDKGFAADLGEIEPTLCVETSPGNRHHWLFLETAVSVDEAQRLGARLRATVGADHDTGNPTQPYRVAGTPNLPGAKKRERGRTASPTSILTEGRSYPPGDLAALLVEPAAAGAAAGHAGTLGAPAVERPPRGVEELLASLSPKRRDDLAAVGVADRSAHFLKTTGWLKGDGFTVDEAAALWSAFPVGAGAEKYGARLAAEVARVWSKAGDDPDLAAETAAIGAEAAERMYRPANGNQAGGGGGASEELLPIVSAADFADRPRPQRQFLDERRLIPLRNVTLLYGDGAIGKSLLAMQLGAAVAVTGQWIGARTRRGGVLYLSAEDDEDETHIRLAEIGDADGFRLQEAQELRIAVMAGRDCVLAVETGRSAVLSWSPLFERLHARLADLRPLLLVIDNLADVFGGNENVKTLARQFVGRLRGLAIEFDMAVVMLAHPSQSGMSSGTGTSGNVAWSNSARSRLYLYREIDEGGGELDPNRRTLENMKANYGPRGTTVGVEWQAGRFLCRDAPAPAPDQPFAGASKAMKAERVFLDLLRWHVRKDKFVSPNKSVSYAPAVFASHPMSEGVKKREFEIAMSALLDRDEIMIFTHGSPSHRRQHIGFPIGTDLENEAA